MFAILRRLLGEAPRVILDAGAGTGALTRRMVAFAERVDAVDPSAAMIAEGRRLRGGDDARIRWIQDRAEDVPLASPYGLITCGASLHWMDLGVVLPRFRQVLAPGACLAIVDTENVHGSYRDEVWAVTRRYLDVADHSDTNESIAALGRSPDFTVEGVERTEPAPFEQSVDHYLEFLHSTSTLAHVRLGRRAERLDEEIRAVFARHSITRLSYGVIGVVAWARPR